MDADNPLISFFRNRIDKDILDNGALVYNKARKIAKLTKVLHQLEIFEASVCIPSYFRNELLGLLLLGNKREGKKFGKDELNFFVALASDVAMAIRNASLFKELELELDKRKRLFIHTTVALAAAIDAKDHYTHGHTERATNLSLEIAKRLSEKNKTDFNKKFFEDLHFASLLHDIGKIGISESILNKDGPLNPEEKKRMQEHPVVGVTIIQPIRELEAASLGVKYHHEKLDGSGYPEKLKGDQIPLIASIISVADSFDAMTTDRPYREGLSKKEAIEEVQREKGKQFSPRIAEALVELYKENKI